MTISLYNDKLLDLNALRLFVAVAETSSFTAAARMLNVPKWTISRSVSSLEADLGIPLLHRTTRSIALSSAGAALVESVAPLISSINKSAIELPEWKGEPAGEVRMSAPIDLGSTFLADAIAQFTTRHRAVRVNVFLGGHMDFELKGYDIAIRALPTRIKDSSLVAKRVCNIYGQVFASPAYLAEFGIPRVPADLVKHELVVIRDVSVLHLIGPDGPVDVTLRGRVCTDDMLFVRAALRSGAGIGFLPTYLAKSDVDAGRLVRVLPDYHKDESHLYILRHQTRQVPHRIRLLVNFLYEYLRSHPLGG